MVVYSKKLLFGSGGVWPVLENEISFLTVYMSLNQVKCVQTMQIGVF